MKKYRIVLAACFAALGTAASAFAAADPSGTWTWTRQMRGETVEATARLQLADGKLTGTVSGFQGAENPIAEGKVEGDQISFKVTVEFGGNQFTSTYQGKIDGDTITGTIARAGGGGGGGEARPPAEWKATRKKT